MAYFYEFGTQSMQPLLFKFVYVFLEDVESMEEVVGIELVLREKLGGTIKFLFSQFDLPVVSQSENGVQERPVGVEIIFVQNCGDLAQLLKMSKHCMKQK